MPTGAPQRPRHPSRLSVALALVLVGGGLAARQAANLPGDQTTPTFRLQVNFVEIDAVVTDDKGRFVRGLTRQDFEVRENGVRQDVSTLSLVDLPVETAARDAAAPVRAGQADSDVASNAQDDGRVYLIVLDTHHVDPLRTPLVRRRAREFVERYLQPGDHAAVAHVGYPTLNREFTSHREGLLDSIDQFIGEKTGSRAVAMANADADSNAPADREERARLRMAEQTVFALGELSKYLAGLRGRRKALVFFSEGLDVDVADNPTHSLVFDALRATYAAAARSNVAFYTVDPRGVADIGEDLIRIGIVPSMRPDNPGYSPGQDLLTELRVAQNSMRNLAEATGGLTSVGSADFERAFTRIVQDNSLYYLLGYLSSDRRLDGKERSIAVRVNRPGLTVRARKSYSADTPAAATASADPVVELLSGPLGTSGLPIRVAAAALPGSPGRARLHVVVEVGGRDLVFTRENGLFATDLDVAVQALGRDGRVQAADRHTLKLRLDPDVRAAVAERGLRDVIEVELPVGRYQLRVAATERAGGRRGSVYADVDVPAFDAAPLALSDLVLTTAEAGRTPSARPAGDLRSQLAGPPTTAREFDPTDTLNVFAIVRSNDPARPVAIATTTIVSRDGVEVFRASTTRDRRAADGSLGVQTSVPLAGLPRGPYVIHVDGSFVGDSSPRQSRSVSIRIR